jgi:hypothetical protein
MSIDCRNLQIKVVRGRTQPMVMRILRCAPTCAPADITGWYFSFTMRSNYTLKQSLISIAYNPIVNLADPTQGQLYWNILGTDTEPLAVGNYVFDMAVTTPYGDGLPRFFCGGTVPLFDNVTDVVNIPAR